LFRSGDETNNRGGRLFVFVRSLRNIIRVYSAKFGLIANYLFKENNVVRLNENITTLIKGTFITYFPVREQITRINRQTPF